jgi:hypothetical protein
VKQLTIKAGTEDGFFISICMIAKVVDRAEPLAQSLIISFPICREPLSNGKMARTQDKLTVAGGLTFPERMPAETPSVPWIQ